MTLEELLRAIDADIRSVNETIEKASKVEGHRAHMARTQLETAKDLLVRARGFCSAKGSGSFQAVTPKKP